MVLCSFLLIFFQNNKEIIHPIFDETRKEYQYNGNMIGRKRFKP